MNSLNIGKKILVLTSTFPRWPSDSELPVVRILSKHLAVKGYDVHIIAPHANGAKFIDNSVGLHIYRFPYFFPFIAQVLCYNGGIMANIKKSWLAKIQIPFLIISEFITGLTLTFLKSPDLIHAHWLIPQGLISILIKFITKKPVIISIHGTDVFAFGTGFMKNLNGWILSHADNVTVNSFATAQVVISRYKVANIEVIPMGVDQSEFQPGLRDVALKTQLTGQDFFLLSVGRLVEQKGFQYIIRALPRLNSQAIRTKLVIIGDGPYKNQLINLTKTYRVTDQVIFLGSVSQDQISRYYASADIFIGPSLDLPGQAAESFGVVFLEALASGIPVIATNVGGIGDIIQDNLTGIVVPPADPDAIAAAVKNIIYHPNLVSRFRSTGLKIIKSKYTWVSVADSFSARYKTLTSN